ncbi:hypothetical protein BJX99DRAFT_229470 [Aspergillus californicus]
MKGARGFRSGVGCAKTCHGIISGDNAVQSTPVYLEDLRPNANSKHCCLSKETITSFERG